MLIKQTKIRKVEIHLSHIETSQSFFIGLENLPAHKDKLTSIGFPDDLPTNTQLLPKVVGNVTRFNTHGKEIKHKDEPLETTYYQREWTWKDWGGYEHSKIVDVPYERYPRSFIEPPSEELKIIDHEGFKLLVSEETTKREKNYDRIKHLINLFLEIFGECIVLNKDYKHLNITKVERLNWEILPPGEYPWDEVKEHVQEGIDDAPKGKQPVIKHRIKTITNYEPTYFGIGVAGFHGYWVFGWPDRNLFILENSNYGNATYIFGEDWKKYSHRSKREIISGDNHKDRLIHRKGWVQEIDQLLNLN